MVFSVGVLSDKRVTSKALSKRRKTPKFIRYQSHKFDRVKPSWRKPRGIDSKIRRRFKGSPAQPRIGYRCQRNLRNIHPDGRKHFTIHNVEQLNMFLMISNRFAATIGHAVGARKRQAIIKRAANLKIKITNARARLRTEEAEE
eukprot:NODE_5168_length_596_cov_434.396709_g4469_i0.p1 GENE.NODE_5168_length_596_cov_434.396709_g4469_i0~~NODE_5168_length_596_cov_434.396709_g4469_i0.p1  ORF type:complete len:144 (-),score=9.60 NODE_5168_length_596_cov_434.396709_g4469_i0:98-529(-)